METGKDKVKKICDVLKKETLEPAKREAETIIQDARREGEYLIEEAKKSIREMQREAKAEIERQKTIFHSSLHQACKQTINALKQEIEKKVFNPELRNLLSEQTKDVKILAKITDAVVNALEKEGIDADLNVFISKSLSPRSINELLSEKVLNKLKDRSVQLGDFEGGIEVKLYKENVTIDITEPVLRELVANYIRKDFRDFVFGTMQ